MFNSLGWPEIGLLIVLALFIFGPERLPKMIGEAGRMLRTLRAMANNAREDLKTELGPELGDLDLASLNPKTFIRQNLFDGQDPAEALGLNGYRIDDGPSDAPPAAPPNGRPKQHKPLTAGERAPFDVDAT
ncbi:MAG: sec-independent translocase [Mycobacteriales bacterium]